jgi:hypothetical protein
MKMGYMSGWPEAKRIRIVYEFSSEQSEREGEDFDELSRVAPSGSAGGESEDRAVPVRAWGVGASEYLVLSLPHGPPLLIVAT